MTQTFKVLSLLLTYPTREICEATADMKAALADEALAGRARGPRGQRPDR